MRTDSSNRWPSITAMRREVKVAGSSVTGNKTLQEMMRIQWLE